MGCRLGAGDGFFSVVYFSQVSGVRAPFRSDAVIRLELGSMGFCLRFLRRVPTERITGPRRSRTRQPRSVRVNPEGVLAGVAAPPLRTGWLRRHVSGKNHDVLDLFAQAEPEIKTKLRQVAQRLATGNIFIGTSSWKYPEWCGQIYDRERYVYRGKFAETRFDRDCLTEYAEVFKTVCVDAAYHRFPSREFLSGLASQVPEDFRFTLKVTEDITIKRFPSIAKFGAKAGLPNEHFLNAELLEHSFLSACEGIRPKVGLLIFEFSRYYPADFRHLHDFTALLDAFLAKLPKGWNYGVELRNKDWLQPDYFALLQKHAVVHVFNNWSAMPTVGEQMVVPSSETSDSMVAARFLLKPGRKYEEAVKAFSPYKSVKEVNDEARAAGKKLIVGAKQQGKQAFIYVNNRLEGNALETIAAMTEGLDLVR